MLGANGGAWVQLPRLRAPGMSHLLYAGQLLALVVPIVGGYIALRLWAERKRRDKRRTLNM